LLPEVAKSSQLNELVGSATPDPSAAAQDEYHLADDRTEAGKHYYKGATLEAPGGERPQRTGENNAFARANYILTPKLGPSGLSGVIAASSTFSSKDEVSAVSVSITDPEFGRGPRHLSFGTQASAVRSDAWVQALDQAREAAAQPIIAHHRLMTSSIVITGGMSVGYVMWLLRGGLLLGSMLSSLPAWQAVDPLPILARGRRAEDEDTSATDPLEKLFGKAKAIRRATREGWDNQAKSPEHERDDVAISRANLSSIGGAAT